MTWTRTSVLVTGGAGFIGSYLVEALVDANAHVTVVDNLRTGKLENLRDVASRISFLQVDVVTAMESTGLDLGDFDVVFHLAANAYIPPSVEDPFRDFNTNVTNTLRLLEGLRHSRRRPKLVYASSAAVYGNPVSLPIREGDPTVPISPYGCGKLAAERYVAVYSSIYGIPATSLRLFSVYGPRQRKQVVFDIFSKLASNAHRLEVLGDGSQVRDLVNVLDVVQAMLVVATASPGVGEVYNVASGSSHTIAELAGLCCEVRGLCTELVFTGSVRSGDADRWEVDTSALEGLGFRPLVALEDGLRDVYKWMADGR